MIVAHLADLHLGYRAYHRLAAGGVNVRERDVSLAFRAAVDRIVELRPDLVLVAGDVFHSVRPSNAAIADAFRQFARLSALLGEVPIVIIAGNHDSPRAVETGSILRLFAEIPNVVAVDDEARSVYLEPLDTSVLCLPHSALLSAERPPMLPDPTARTNILMLHATVAGTDLDDSLRRLSEYGGVIVDVDAIGPDRWDYVALGHYHLTAQVAQNMWYPGGIERTSNNVWEEASSEKGFLVYDTSARSATFHAVPTRTVIDLPRISALRGSPDAPEASRFYGAAELDEKIEQTIAAVPGGIHGKIVRLVITDLPRDLLRELDHRRIRQYRADALHFHLDARKPVTMRLSGSGAPGQRRTLEEELENYLAHHWQATVPGIEIPRLVTLGRRYLAEARSAPADDEPLLEPVPLE